MSKIIISLSCSLFSKPIQHISFVFLNPFDVGCGLLYSLLHGQSGWAKTDMTVFLLKFLQLKGDREKQDIMKQKFCNFLFSFFPLWKTSRKCRVYYSVAVAAAYFTSCNSNSVENLFVIPLTRLVKENDPFPYLNEKKKKKNAVYLYWSWSAEGNYPYPAV